MTQSRNGMRVLARFMMAATDASQLPAPTLPEIAFLGRSNVGKSSVINSLLAAKVAKTSSAPGRTRSINFYEVRWPGKPQPELIFTDLPGYGYARVAWKVSQQWPAFVEPYLRERRSLASSGRRFVIAATKSDRLSANQLRNSLQTLTQEHPGTRIVPCSARLGTGREELWQEIRLAVESLRAARL
jgi:GTP-binding protein